MDDLLKEYGVEFLGDFLAVLFSVAGTAWGLWKAHMRRKLKAELDLERAREEEKKERDNWMPLKMLAEQETNQDLDDVRESDPHIVRVSIVEVHNGPRPPAGNKITIKRSTRDGVPSLHRRWINKTMDRWYAEKINATIQEGDVEWKCQKHVEEAKTRQKEVDGVLPPPNEGDGDIYPQPELIEVWSKDGIAFALTHYIGSENRRSFILATEWDKVPEELPMEYREAFRRATKRIKGRLKYLGEPPPERPLPAPSTF